MTFASNSSPTSFTGATQRITAPLRRIETDWLRVLAFVAVILLVLPIVYAGLAVWYVLIFGVFSWLVIPWRLHRRSQRRAQDVAQAQLAAMQAMAGQR